MPHTYKEWLEAIGRPTRWVDEYMLAAMANRMERNITVFCWENGKWEKGWVIPPYNPKIAQKARQQSPVTVCLKDKHYYGLLVDGEVPKEWGDPPLQERASSALRGCGWMPSTPQSGRATVTSAGPPEGGAAAAGMPGTPVSMAMAGQQECEAKRAQEQDERKGGSSSPEVQRWMPATPGTAGRHSAPASTASWTQLSTEGVRRRLREKQRPRTRSEEGMPEEAAEDGNLTSQRQPRGGEGRGGEGGTATAAASTAASAAAAAEAASSRKGWMPATPGTASLPLALPSGAEDRLVPKGISTTIADGLEELRGMEENEEEQEEKEEAAGTAPPPAGRLPSWRCPLCIEVPWVAEAPKWKGVYARKATHLRKAHPEEAVALLRNRAPPPTLIEATTALPPAQREWTCGMCDAGLPTLGRAQGRLSRRRHWQTCHDDVSFEEFCRREVTKRNLAVQQSRFPEHALVALPYRGHAENVEYRKDGTRVTMTQFRCKRCLFAVAGAKVLSGQLRHGLSCEQSRQYALTNSNARSQLREWWLEVRKAEEEEETLRKLEWDREFLNLLVDEWCPSASSYAPYRRRPDEGAEEYETRTSQVRARQVRARLKYRQQHAKGGRKAPPKRSKAPAKRDEDQEEEEAKEAKEAGAPERRQRKKEEAPSTNAGAGGGKRRQRRQEDIRGPARKQRRKDEAGGPARRQEAAVAPASRLKRLPQEEAPERRTRQRLPSRQGRGCKAPRS